MYMKLLFVALLAFTCHGTFAQTMPDFDLIKIEKTQDYKPAEPFVLQTCNYLFATPVVKGNNNRLKSMQFIFRWMSGTPDYSFTFDNNVFKTIKDNTDLVGLYLAGMAKYALENPAEAKDAKLVKLSGVTAMLNFCENPNNKIKINRQLKKLIEARDAGTLDEML